MEEANNREENDLDNLLQDYSIDNDSLADSDQYSAGVSVSISSNIDNMQKQQQYRPGNNHTPFVEKNTS